VRREDLALLDMFAAASLTGQNANPDCESDRSSFAMADIAYADARAMLRRRAIVLDEIENEEREA